MINALRISEWNSTGDKNRFLKTPQASFGGGFVPWATIKCHQGVLALARVLDLQDTAWPVLQVQGIHFERSPLARSQLYFVDLLLST